MAGTRSRGERTVSLGALGEVQCRPGLRALEAIDDPDGRGSLTTRLRRLALAPSLSDVVDVIYETHVDAAAAEGRPAPYNRTEIGEAIIDVGIETVREAAAEMVLSAWSRHAVEDTQGNEQRAEGTTTLPPAPSGPNSRVLQ